MKILIAGGTGFLGRALRQKLLAAGHEVTVLTRKVRVSPNKKERFVAWDAKTPGDWADCLEGADAVINLAGENIASARWTPVRKRVLLSSRVDATRALVTVLQTVREKPALLISASAVGYYGDVPEVPLTEANAAGEGFLAEICARWEDEARKAESSGIRVVLVRLGPVLGEKGGLLSRMVPAFRFFMGAIPGTGRQWISWIHQEDVAGALLFLIGREDLSGPFNLTSPEPATLKTFCAALAKVLGRPRGFPVPGFLLGVFLGEMSAMVLSSQKAFPEKLLRAGYRFRHPDLREALGSILERR